MANLSRNEAYLVDSTLGIIAKKMLAKGYNFCKTNHRYYGNILEQAHTMNRKILTLDIYFSCVFENVFILTDF